VNFISTRGNTPATGLGAAIAAGLAPDGGLYVPASLPTFSIDDYTGCTTLAETGARLLEPFFAEDSLAGSLKDICAEAFNFPTPLKPLAAADTFVLELFHGPTAAFKDVGARFLAACMKRLRAGQSKPLTILVATSGDTGAAVAAAFHRLPGLRVVILYPDGRVSPRQAHQLGCFGDNVRALRVAGSFDDCQAMVKQALNDGSLQSRLPMSSANSISLGRLLPQMTYYALAALQYWRASEQPLNFVIPTGNLGNAIGAALTRAVGLPVGRIALATNANHVLPDFFAGGEYRPAASIATLANAMDVGAPSNFERLRWLYPDDVRLRASFSAKSIGDAEIRSTISTSRSRYGEIFCPHTATAVRALEILREGGETGAWTVVATAHPAKFEAIVEPLVGAPVPVPPALAELLSRPTSAEPLAAHYPALRDRLIEMDAP
jgi:threonine synthase